MLVKNMKKLNKESDACSEWQRPHIEEARVKQLRVLIDGPP